MLHSVFIMQLLMNQIDVNLNYRQRRVYLKTCIDIAEYLKTTHDTLQFWWRKNSPQKKKQGKKVNKPEQQKGRDTADAVCLK